MSALPEFVCPPCFESMEQYQGWLRELFLCNKGERDKFKNHGYCMDCTPEFQGRMIAEDRCNFPSVFFRVDIDGIVQGHRFNARSKFTGRGKVRIVAP